MQGFLEPRAPVPSLSERRSCPAVAARALSANGARTRGGSMVDLLVSLPISTCATPPLPPLSRPLLLFSSFITTEGEADDIPPAASRLWGNPRER